MRVPGMHGEDATGVEAEDSAEDAPLHVVIVYSGVSGDKITELALLSTSSVQQIKQHLQDVVDCSMYRQSLLSIGDEEEVDDNEALAMFPNPFEVKVIKLTATDDADTNSSLISAAGSGNLGQVVAMLRFLADVDSIDTLGWVAVHGSLLFIFGFV